MHDSAILPLQMVNHGKTMVTMDDLAI